MQKLKILFIIIILIAAVFGVRFIYFRFIKTYEVGKDPALSEIKRAYYMTSMYSSDYGYIYDKYSINAWDMKYYAETDIFDEDKGEQVVTKTEISRDEYMEILKLLEGCRYVREGKSDPNRMDGFMDSSNSSADIMWDNIPDGAFELAMDKETRKSFTDAVSNAVKTINISFTDDIALSSVWVLRDTPENRKASVFGTAMLIPDETGREYSFDIPLSSDNKYLFRMIDNDGIYYATEIPELKPHWKLRIYSGGSFSDVRLDVFDDKGNLKYECSVFNAAL